MTVLIELLIFDCDGVLVDSERLSHGVLQQMLAELGVTLSFDATVERFIGSSLPVCMARVSELLGGTPPEDFVERFGQRTRAAFEAGLVAVRGVEPLLDLLLTPFCVASNGNRKKVEFTLGHTGLLPRFAGRIFTADDVVHPKPAPDLFLHAARSLGETPQRRTVVEDTPTGIAAAKAAGMRAIGFAAMTPRPCLAAAGADALVDSMDELQALLAAG
ncbi:MAG: family hydrolase [Proteobacteria bacterium]|nr:family hydrolase [Pseudomonadota bacterium]